MKKKLFLLGIVLVLAVSVYAFDQVYSSDKNGTLVDSGQLHTNHVRWVVADTTSSAGTEPTDLAVTERTYQTVKTAIGVGASGDDEISIFDVPRGWNGIRIRAIGITDNGTYKTRIYLGTLGDGNRDTDSTSVDCELSFAGYLEWVIGTQVSTTSTYELADAVTITSSDWTSSWTSTTPGGERVAEAKIDLQGADVVIIVSDNASSNSKLLVKGF